MHHFLDMENYGSPPHCSVVRGTRPMVFPVYFSSYGLVHDHLIIPADESIVTLYGAYRVPKDIYGWAEQAKKLGYPRVILEMGLLHPPGVLEKVVQYEDDLANIRSQSNSTPTNKRSLRCSWLPDSIPAVLRNGVGKRS